MSLQLPDISADGVAADGSKEYFEDMQICVVWQSANGSVADKLEGEKFHILSEFWWFGCNLGTDYFLESLNFLVKEGVWHNQLGVVSVKVYISVIRDRKKLIHIQYNKSVTISLQFTFLPVTSPFSFRRVLSSWSRTSHIRATWFTGKFSFYREYMRFSFRAYRCGFVHICSKVIEFV